jgi:hypothetical protein
MKATFVLPGWIRWRFRTLPSRIRVRRWKVSRFKVAIRRAAHFQDLLDSGRVLDKGRVSEAERFSQALGSSSMLNGIR